MTGCHCRRVNDATLGRTLASRTALATHWRIVTTPTGPSTGKDCAATAAPSWTEVAQPVISAMPAAQSFCPDAETGAVVPDLPAAAGAVPAEVLMNRSLLPLEPCAKCMYRSSYT